MRRNTLALSDRCGGSPAQGSDFAAATPYLNTTNGPQTRTMHISAATVNLLPGKDRAGYDPAGHQQDASR
ncbi:hypothetical protein [Streptomyces acidicola]|uniref:Uncharacterized protein n=1 Tax=Streptomyces acidicola TaxID=2596892 RepID=A0A5N8X4P0_9ACTN|nr:hypothetical protein [Streptomyces acidicola]MPY54282.1 hypothetical protein [Streptomyces acidicola]